MSSTEVVTVPLDGLVDKIAAEIARHRWDRLTVGRQCYCGELRNGDGEAMVPHQAAAIESLLQSLAVRP